MIGNLTLSELEIEKFPGLDVLARKVSFDCKLEFVFDNFFGVVQPGCTMEFLTVSPHNLKELRGFRPSENAKGTVDSSTRKRGCLYIASSELQKLQNELI